MKEKENLIFLLESYLEKRIEITILNEFAWKMIDFFSNKANSDTVPKQSFENEFWYIIWQLQHLSDKEHETDGLMKKFSREALAYLKNEKKMPENYFGERP